jgi:3-hydroxy acid dehydrogenase/malonic semialdehyde reductase
MKNSTKPLQNKTALITGASSGIGYATALRLAQAGCNLNLVSRREERLVELKNFVEKEFSIKATIVAGDITQSETIDKMSKLNFFESDILINNAGAAFGRDEVKDLKLSDIKSTIELNVIAPFHLISLTLPSMLKKEEGDIISIGSISGQDPYPGAATYCASKAALKTFQQSLRQEVYGKNIRVMLISPGMVESEFSLARWKQNSEMAKATYKGMTPLTPDDIALEVLHVLTNPRRGYVDDLVILATDQGGAVLVRRKT